MPARPVTARDSARGAELQRALVELADVDPLIRLRPDAQPGSLLIDVYVEVQREVLAETLASEHGIVADFSPTPAACVERPAAVGRSVRRLSEADHHRAVTVAVTVSPGAPGSGVQVVVAAPRLTLSLRFDRRRPGGRWVTVLTGTVPSVEVDAVRTALPTAAHGLAVLESALDHHAPAHHRRPDLCRPCGRQDGRSACRRLGIAGSTPVQFKAT